MTQWQPIETAPKDGTKFLATDGNLLGVGYHHKEVEPETVLNIEKWKAYYGKVREPFKVPFTTNGLFPEGFDYLENCRLSDDAWEKAKAEAPPFEHLPNPKAGEVREWDYAHAFHSFDGKTAVDDYDGPVGFKPTHWMPLPAPPANGELRTYAGETK